MSEIPSDIKSRKLLNSFHAYCDQHPEERFWQALRNWSGASTVQITRNTNSEVRFDTFHWEGKNG